MSSFEALKYNILFNGGICVISLVAFSVVVRLGFNSQVAPRIWARPPAVLKNVLKSPYGIRWIPWALNLSYTEMLEGIPGTGTRRNGWSGPMLKCNLDGIIVMKFHGLCLRVAVFATILCCVVILPLNYTAECDEKAVGASVCAGMTNLTDFEKTTLAHIPAMDFSEGSETTDADGEFTVDYVRNVFKEYFSTAPGITSRLFGVVIVAWCIYIYACKLIWNEWIDNLALRRAYYLERDHFEARKEELDCIATLQDPEDPLQEDRPPYLPHPELRETVPSVCLYSVLYRLPQQYCSPVVSQTASMVDRQLSATVDFFDKCVPNQPGFSSSVAAVTILPDCSQVAHAWKRWYACASKLRRLRFIRHRLRLLRRKNEQEEEIAFLSESPRPETVSPLQEESAFDTNRPDDCNISKTAINPQTEYCATSTADSNDANKTTSENVLEFLNFAPSSVPVFTTVKEEGSAESEESISGDLNQSSPSTVDRDTAVIAESHSSEKPVKSENSVNDDSKKATSCGTTDSAVKRLIASTQVGLAEEAKLETFLSDDGMEQLAVYCREFSQSSASCCPYGCDEYRIRHADVDTLEELEEEAEEAVRQANELLVEARASVSRDNYDEEPIFYSKVRSRELSRLNEEADGSEELQDCLHNSSIVDASTTIMRRRGSSVELSWQVANEIAQDKQRPKLTRRNAVRLRNLSSGRWHIPVINSLKDWVVGRGQAVLESKVRGLKQAAGGVIGQSTYAIVTFTSRQAAIAARQCLADASGGVNRWIEIEDIPVPPLADAPPCDILACRGVCRPVTFTIKDNRKRWRNNWTIFCIAIFYLLYTVPLSATSNLLSTENLEKVFPNFERLETISGILTGWLYTLFFSVCPFIFKAFSNYGSGAASLRQAEFSAIRYYWFFMLLTAFFGTSLVTMVTRGFYSGISLGSQAQEILRSVASTIPTQVSATWLNWIIVKGLATFPMFYLLQINTFLFSMFGMKCCARLMSGGGPGGPMPFRIYVDSGVVFLCIVALAPACPLVAPAGMIYYLIFSPMIRWLLIFVYRPEYDGGGFRWPLIHDMFISAMIMAQVLLTTMMILKYAYGPAALAGLSLLPTYTFSAIAKDRFLRCYQDAGLLQTSQLDGWDTSKPTSVEMREEYRKWLVDCHKASFVPICLAGLDSFITGEPSVVVPTERDRDEFEEAEIHSGESAHLLGPSFPHTDQRGAVFSRLSGIAQSQRSDPSRFHSV